MHIFADYKKTILPTNVATLSHRLIEFYGQLDWDNTTLLTATAPVSPLPAFFIIIARGAQPILATELQSRP